MTEASHLMQSAKNKYFEGIYNKPFCDLMKEFGTVAFQPWITVFRGNGKDSNEDTSFELWYITESICYDEFINNDDFQSLSKDQQTYVIDFITAFRTETTESWTAMDAHW